MRAHTVQETRGEMMLVACPICCGPLIHLHPKTLPECASRCARRARLPRHPAAAGPSGTQRSLRSRHAVSRRHAAPPACPAAMPSHQAGALACHSGPWTGCQFALWRTRLGCIWMCGEGGGEGKAGGVWGQHGASAEHGSDGTHLSAGTPR